MNQQQISKYLERIGLTKPETLTADSLHELIRAHLMNVPFENLTVFVEEKVPDLSLETLYHKIVEKKRGGYCFELNGLFFDLLKELGFDIYPIGVRIQRPGWVVSPVTHRGAIAELPDGKYYVDVGFGGPGPKGLLKLTEGEQVVDGQTFYVTREGEGWFVERLDREEKVPLFRFNERFFEDVDFDTVNFYCARSGGPFQQGYMLNLCLEKGSKALTGYQLTIRDDGEVTRIDLKDDAEVMRMAKEHFGLEL